MDGSGGPSARWCCLSCEHRDRARSERLVGHDSRNHQRSVGRRAARSDGDAHQPCAAGPRARSGDRHRRRIPVRRSSRRDLSPEVRADRIQHADSRRSSADRRFHRARRREHESRRDGRIGHRQRPESRSSTSRAPARASRSRRKCSTPCRAAATCRTSSPWRRA